MKKTLLALSIGLGCLASAQAETCPDILQFTAQKLRSKDSVDFCQAYQGKVILAVNTASQCGFTPQFKGLEALYQKYKDRNFVILGFPSNDFHQEFAQEEKTSDMCYINYGVTFPMFKASSVRGDEANAFFKKLTAQSGTAPKWNFYKYLIGPDGKVVESFASMTTPEDKGLIEKIEALLPKP
ncbi:MAG: glutathione peroxidase [Candidatus Methylumidiphilus sp.]